MFDKRRGKPCRQRVPFATVEKVLEGTKRKTDRPMYLCD
jgi:hypothetical protein